MSRHSSRPVTAKRIFASYAPARESDGDWHVGVMYDRQELHIYQARESAQTFLKQARAARMRGDLKTWDWCMVRAAQWRAELGGLLRSGGRVDWRGEPVGENV